VTPRQALAIILGCSSLLVPVIAEVHGYDARALTAYGLGFVVLLVALAGAWQLDRPSSAPAETPRTHRAMRVGLVLGVLWVAEISINNFIAPPLPARDHIDNAFWAVIAMAIFVLSVDAAYRADRLRDGVIAGAWSGFASGAVACCMALCLIAFGMRAILADPLNRAEWAARGAQGGAPTMAAYFAGETFAGALLHLTVLGVVMGALLGALGGAVGKGVRRAAASTRAT
jgi:hypothetical protein